MGFFDKFKKNDTIPVTDSKDIVAPVKGTMIPPSEISDPVFAQEVMGQTIGFVPEEETIVCPVNGKVEVLFPTNHAFGIRDAFGTVFLVHIGIDTVSLNGKGFKAFIKVGDQVKAGQKAVEIDTNKLKNAGYNLTTMLIVSEKETEDFKVNYIPYGTVEKGQKINV